MGKICTTIFRPKQPKNSFGVERTYMAYVREYPPPPGGGGSTPLTLEQQQVY